MNNSNENLNSELEIIYICRFHVNSNKVIKYINKYNYYKKKEN